MSAEQPQKRDDIKRIISKGAACFIIILNEMWIDTCNHKPFIQTTHQAHTNDDNNTQKSSHEFKYGLVFSRCVRTQCALLFFCWDKHRQCTIIGLNSRHNGTYTHNMFRWLHNQATWWANAVVASFYNEIHLIIL